jgi:hypothetical protein
MIKSFALFAVLAWAEDFETDMVEQIKMEYAPSDDSRRADGERYHVTYQNLFL